MKNPRLAQLMMSKNLADKQISKLTQSQKSALEKSWDIEHAYYSSVLEGSKLDRGEFEKLALKVT